MLLKASHHAGIFLATLFRLRLLILTVYQRA